LRRNVLHVRTDPALSSHRFRPLCPVSGSAARAPERARRVVAELRNRTRSAGGDYCTGGREPRAKAL